jgi:release factor glutamine methyltransferase
MDEVLHQEERFAVIIADPPWVPTNDVARFPEDPVGAIDGGVDGLDLVRSCLLVIDQHLAVAGSAVLQTGPDQADHVAQMVAGYDELAVVEVRQLERGALIRVDRLVTPTA